MNIEALQYGLLNAFAGIAVLACGFRVLALSPALGGIAIACGLVVILISSSRLQRELDKGDS